MRASPPQLRQYRSSIDVSRRPGSAHGPRRLRAWRDLQSHRQARFIFNRLSGTPTAHSSSPHRIASSQAVSRPEAKSTGRNRCVSRVSRVGPRGFPLASTSPPTRVHFSAVDVALHDFSATPWAAYAAGQATENSHGRYRHSQHALPPGLDAIPQGRTLYPPVSANWSVSLAAPTAAPRVSRSRIAVHFSSLGTSCTRICSQPALSSARRFAYRSCA